ncbi:hypothetical protein BH23GEM8_BH23GEM8_01350 [soil metagenome]
MISLAELWLPILLSGVAVFVASSIINMFLPYHRSDYRKLPNEESVMGAMRSSDLTPGDYVFPHAEGVAAMASEDYIARRSQGPVGFLTIMKSGPVSMGPQLAMWFVFTLVVSLVAAYLASRTLAPGSEYLDVFRVTGTVAFAGYVLALWQNAIWFGRSWVATAKFSFDGLIYALLTAGVFGWLWP